MVICIFSLFLCFLYLFSFHFLNEYIESILLCLLKCFFRRKSQHIIEPDYLSSLHLGLIYNSSLIINIAYHYFSKSLQFKLYMWQNIVDWFLYIFGMLLYVSFRDILHDCPGYVFSCVLFVTYFVSLWQFWFSHPFLILGL